MKEGEEKDLSIPENCPSLDYIIEGFTIKEIACIGLITVLCIGLALIIYGVTGNSFMGVLTAGVILAGAIIFLRRDIYTENCIDKIKLLLEYRKMPKALIFKYKNIYEEE